MRTRLISLMIAGTFALIAAPSAHAGSYTVLGCQAPTGAAAPMNGWQVSLGGQPTLARWANFCPADAAMALIPNVAVPAGDSVSETLTAPPGMTIEKYTFWRAVHLNAAAGYEYGQYVNSAGIGWTRIEGCTAVDACGTFGNYQEPTASVNHEPVTPPAGTTQVRLDVACGATKGCPAQATTNEVWLYKTSELLEDNITPQFTGAPSGPLVSGGELSGIESVAISATDQGSGVYQAQIEVDGQVVESQVLQNLAGTCQPPWTVVVPCPSSASGSMSFNTAQLPDGTHSLQILVTDPAGNTVAWPAWGPMTITTVNNPCSPSPAATGMALHAAFSGTKAQAAKKGRKATSITVAYRSRPKVTGTLTSSDGAPIANAMVCVSQQANAPGSSMRQVAYLQTNAAGGFSYKIAQGPSRTLYFIHRVTGGAIASSVHVSVHVPVQVHLNHRRLRNDQTMTWTGKLPGPVPSGLIGLMEVWRGSYWQAFQNVAIGRKGSWAASYRFSRTTGCQAYTFRMLVPQQSQYPYAVGWSKRLHVLVTGPGAPKAGCRT